MSASANGTLLSNPASGSLIDPSGNVWTIGGTAPTPGSWIAGTGLTMANGVQAGGGNNAILLTLINGVVYQLNTLNQWYSWTGVWVAVPNPIPAAIAAAAPAPVVTPTSVTLVPGESISVNFPSSAKVTVEAAPAAAA